MLINKTPIVGTRSQKIRVLFKPALSCLLLLFLFQTALAQFYNGSQLSFGKNRVQYQKFNWTYYRTDQFDVYFYPTGKALAEYTLFKAPEIIQELEKTLNFSSTKKIQFIVYNTQLDFRESNFAYDNEDFYNQGGITNIYGTKVYLYFDGNHAHFDRMIRSGVMNIFSHFLVEGQSVGSNISSENLLNVPNWYYSGLASYMGEAWNSEVEAHVKDGILSQRYADFDELSPVDATYAGHSFWKYVVDLYGENAISNILYSTRSSRSFEKGFYYVTGIDYSQLLINWYKYYYILFQQDMNRTLPANDGILKKVNKKRDYSQLALSPNGHAYAFITNEAGKVIVWLKTPAMKKPKPIFRKYQKIEDNPDLTFPLLNWHPTGKILGITLEDKGRCYYYPFNIDDNKWEKRLLVDVEKISDWNYSPDGKLMLFSGFKNGQSDIFLYSFRARSYQNLTQDFYDDYAPIFVDQQNKIVFSSNRPHDTIKLNEPFYLTKPQPFHDLFMYHFDKKDNLLLRITNTPQANETMPCAVSNNQITYLSNEKGIVNRNIAQFDSTISRIDTIIHYAYYAKSQNLTDNAYSIVEHNYNPKAHLTAEIILHKGAKRLYIYPDDLTTLKTEIAVSAFQKKFLEDKQRKDSIAAKKRAKTKDRVNNTPNKKRGFYQVHQSDIVTKPIALDNKTITPEKTPDSTIITPEKQILFEAPVMKNYYVQYSLNQLVTQLDFSFLNTSYQQFAGGTSPIYLNTGFNALFMLGVNDLFEDYRITGGVRFSVDLNNNEFMLSFENLSKRIDHQLIVYRQSLQSTIDYYLYKQHSNSVFYIMKFPFDKMNSVRMTLTGRYENSIMGSLNDYSLKAANENHLWAGVKLEYIFDSSKELYTNLWRGTKFKVFAEYEHRLEKEQMNLFVVGFDLRKSFKIYKRMVWANRLAGSASTGSAQLVYYMGGVDNWMFAKFNSNIWVDQTKNYAYQTLATNMRGFEQNIRNGTSFVVFNSELRIPFMQMFSKNRVKNNFINSLQLLLFGDFGTAWTGITPYSEENCLYTRYIYSGPFSIKIKRQVDPFVGGIGLGLRAKLFGYLLRLDYAWGIEDYKIVNKKGMLLFSLGLDF